MLKPSASSAAAASQRRRAAEPLRVDRPMTKSCAPLVVSAPDMQHADQGKEPPRGGEVGFDLALEPFEQQLGGFVVDAAAGHVDRLDLARGGATDRLVIAVADREVVADRA